MKTFIQISFNIGDDYFYDNLIKPLNIFAFYKKCDIIKD